MLKIESNLAVRSKVRLVYTESRFLLVIDFEIKDISVIDFDLKSYQVIYLLVQ